MISTAAIERVDPKESYPVASHSGKQNIENSAKRSLANNHQRTVANVEASGLT
jgi:hypothetical protein